VIGLKTIKVGKAIENIDESHGLTPTVAICHSEQKSGDLGFESPLSPPVQIFRDLGQVRSNPLYCRHL
ncbi:MAG TPA: hypothetical protein VMO20_00295, partial [Candidatus Acidoferrum sp.]|nr:hypothetical protein [Candidatus Acidoferrum sp.]